MNKEQLYESLARSLASKPLSDNQLASLARKIGSSKHPVVGVDVCTYGICLDFAVAEKLEDFSLSEILEVGIGPIRNVEIFPEGIILPDRLNVRVTQKL